LNVVLASSVSSMSAESYPIGGSTGRGVSPARARRKMRVQDGYAGGRPGPRRPAK
jgi:hypothetical protein